MIHSYPTKMASLSFKLIADESRSGMSIGYLHNTTSTDTFVITESLAAVLWQLMSSSVRQKTCVVVWFGTEKESASIPGLKTIPPPNDLQGAMESVFWKGFRGQDDFVRDLVAIWSTFGGVRIYPADFGEQLPDAVYSHTFDRRDEMHLGMDYSGQDRPALDASQGVFSKLLGTVRAAARFSKNLTSAEFREALMNPFQSVRDAEVVRKLGLYVRKGGGGCLELFTTSGSIGDSLSKLLAEYGIACSFTNERRSKWG